MGGGADLHLGVVLEPDIHPLPHGVLLRSLWFVAGGVPALPAVALPFSEIARLLALRCAVILIYPVFFSSSEKQFERKKFLSPCFQMAGSFAYRNVFTAPRLQVSHSTVSPVGLASPIVPHRTVQGRVTALQSESR